MKLGEGPADANKARAEAIASAKAELSRALEVPLSNIALVSAAASKWPDASLGCPQPGRMYAQVVTRGWTVLLKADGNTHEVHVSRKRAVMCGKAERKLGPTPAK